MAKKFGGKYSPDTPHPDTGTSSPLASKFRGRKVYQSNIRSKLLFFAPLPLLFAGIGEMRSGDGLGMIMEFGALAILLLAAWLLVEGLKAETAYNERKVARPPAIPRKMMASALTGLGVALAVFAGWGPAIFTPLIYGVLAAGAHSFSFGIDPLRKKGMEGFNEFETDRVAKAVEKAEGLLAETLSAAKRFNDRQLEGRVETLASSAREMFRAVEDDPRDLSSARKFLSVYLMGARDATLKFADLYSKNRDADARAEYETLLGDLEGSFQGQRRKLLLDDRSDLDVEIEVLRDRLQQEGVKTR